MNRRAVTIVEFLVVLAIISALVALAMPALHSARERSREVVCINNLTEIDLAMKQFLRAHKKMQPNVSTGLIGGWCVELMPLLDLSGARNGLVVGAQADDSVKMKFHLPPIFRCPSRQNQHAGQYSHFAIDYDDENDLYMFFDAPVSTDYPWISGLSMPHINMQVSKGAHRGGFHFADGVHPVQLMIDGKTIQP